jgi:hypothetical protein
MTRSLAVIALTLAALSLGPSWAHVLEAPPRLEWPAELWRQATVFGGQFRLFAYLGGPIDLLAILLPALLAWRVRGQPGGRLVAAGAALFGAALLVWFLWVQGANAVLASWTPGPPPADFDAVRRRWETGHMAVAGLKLLGFVVLACGAGPGLCGAVRR